MSCDQTKRAAGVRILSLAMERSADGRTRIPDGLTVLEMLGITYDPTAGRTSKRGR